jgi:hypothetical protein
MVFAMVEIGASAVLVILAVKSVKSKRPKKAYEKGLLELTDCEDDSFRVTSK